MSVSVIRDAFFERHDPGPGHPESPARFRAIDEALNAAAEGGLSIISPAVRPATREEMARVHTATYLDHLDAVDGTSTSLDGDTHTSPPSIQAAHQAAGASIDLAVGVAEGTLPPGIAVVRPPGHHALPDRAMGFCLVNNVAVAARAVQAAGAQRVAIYDWDVHHGNGTQAMFYDDPDVLYLSTHQYPFYPGTGATRETGTGAGEDQTINVPLPAGTPDAVLLAVSRELLIPKIEAFQPDVILISAGFDPFVNDPLGGFAITQDGFYELARLWRDTAENVCGGRIAAVLEGGYDLHGLSEGVCGLARAWDT